MNRDKLFPGFPTRKAVIEFFEKEPNKRYEASGQGARSYCPIEAAAGRNNVLGVGVSTYTLNGVRHFAPKWATKFVRCVDEIGWGNLTHGEIAKIARNVR